MKNEDFIRDFFEMPKANPAELAKERRRYALLQAAVTLQASIAMGINDSITRATLTLAEIEKRESQ